jgi:hypothetical protein
VAASRRKNSLVAARKRTPPSQPTKATPGTVPLHRLPPHALSGVDRRHREPSVGDLHRHGGWPAPCGEKIVDPMSRPPLMFQPSSSDASALASGRVPLAMAFLACLCATGRYAPLPALPNTSIQHPMLRLRLRQDAQTRATFPTFSRSAPAACTSLIPSSLLLAFLVLLLIWPDGDT